LLLRGSFYAKWNKVLNGMRFCDKFPRIRCPAILMSLAWGLQLDHSAHNMVLVSTCWVSWPIKMTSLFDFCDCLLFSNWLESTVVWIVDQQNHAWGSGCEGAHILLKISHYNFTNFTWIEKLIESSTVSYRMVNWWQAPSSFFHNRTFW